MNDILNILKCILDDNKVLYVSTPINTGERYIDWYIENVGSLDNDEMEKSKIHNVIEPNIRNAKVNIDRIKRTVNKTVIDPTVLENDLLKWDQNDYYEFWKQFIKSFADGIVFLDGWEFSIGCCHEFLSAVENNIQMYTQNLQPMTTFDAIQKMNLSIGKYAKYQMVEAGALKNILSRIEECNKGAFFDFMLKEKMKDEKLDFLSSNDIANVAQFISFDPRSGSKPKCVHINGIESDVSLSTKELIEKLILSSSTKSVNIRSFSPDTMKGNKLIFDKKINDVDEIIKIIEENSAIGKHSIVNENISIFDSGVSGVALGDIIEFSPEDTPKCVDKEGVCSLPRPLGRKILNTVYGFDPNINFDPSFRIEFSIHPNKRGVKQEHTIVWEYEHYDNIVNDNRVNWPNRFSRFIGDKVFGLLVADSLGLLVPKTTVISRKVAPFSFGTETGQKEKWIRTCPIVKEPGKYYTGSSWTDPFSLMNQEEARGQHNTNIASILSQDAVKAMYSGASFVRFEDCNDVIEGVEGNGDEFMVGIKNNEPLPDDVFRAVKNLNNQIRKYHNILSDVSFEWVYDGNDVWIVQMNQLKALKIGTGINRRIIVEGTPSHYEKVYTDDGLDSLRSKISLIKGKNVGVELMGNVGITSHFGDLLRQANIPSIITAN